MCGVLAGGNIFVQVLRKVDEICLCIHRIFFEIFGLCALGI